MSNPQWQRYSSGNTDFTRAMKICDHSGMVVLLARSKVGGDNNDGTGRWLYGDFIVGAKYAEVCTLEKTYRVEDFEVLMDHVGNCKWVKCYGGYVPDFAICGGTHLFNDEPFFLGRVDVGLGGTGKVFRGGFILPSYAACFVPTSSNARASVCNSVRETDRAKQVSTYHEYEVLQEWQASINESIGTLLERMNEEKVLSELAILLQLHFHGPSQRAFHDAISKLWATSGLDFRFFLPEALPWLLDLGRIHGLPSCLRQCLHRRLEASELNKEEDPRVVIKLLRLFKYSATNGFHYKFGTTERRNAILFHNVKLGDHIKTWLNRMKADQEEGIIGEQPRLAELLQTASSRTSEFENPFESQERHEMKSKERQTEGTKRKSLFSPSNSNRRAPAPHSVMIQKQIMDSDFGIQVTIQDEQMVADPELTQTLSRSELEYYEEHARAYLEDGSCCEEVAAVVKTLLDSCHRETEMSGAVEESVVGHVAESADGHVVESVDDHVDDQVEESVDGQVEDETQLIESQAQVISLYEMFSILLTCPTIGGPSADVSKYLNPLLERHISNRWGGTLTTKEISDLLEIEAFKTEAIPNELKALLAKGFVLSVHDHLENGALISMVEKTAFDFIVTHATTNLDFNLILYVTRILTDSPTSPDQLGCAIVSKLVDFLKNMAAGQFLQGNSAVTSTLRLIQEKCSTYSTDTIEIIGKYLESGSRQAGRTYCAQWLKRAATEANMCLDEKTLTILRDSLDDPNPCIKYNSRTAFATEINKQMSQWTSQTFPHAVILSEIIATEPIILTLAGKKPEYFTHSINLPILQVLNYYHVKHSNSKWKVRKCIEKLFGKDSNPQQSLSKGWECVWTEGLKFLSEQEDAIPAAVFEAVDKVFVEQDNCSVLPACAEFISKKVEQSRDSQHISLSLHFLEQLCRRLRLSGRDSNRRVYLECLHRLREWQELPDHIFQVYHIEAGADRLLSVSHNSEKEQVVRKLRMDVQPSEEAGVTENILGWIEIYLRSGFFLSTGLIEAYESADTTESLTAGLIAAAINGQVIPENILSKVLQGFLSSPMSKRKFELDLELARACLKNQSLPGQVLTKILKCLCQAERCVESESTTEACLTVICSAYLLNRKLLTVSGIRKLFSDSGIGRFLSASEQRDLRSSNEKIILTLFKKFFIPESDSKDRLQGTSNLFLLTKQLAQKNTEDILTGSTATAQAPSRATEEQEFRELIKNAMELHVLRDTEQFQSLIRLLRSNSAARTFLKQTLMTLEPSIMKKFWSRGTQLPIMDTLPFARAAFISMVTSSTEEAAEGCRDILELICTKFVQQDFRLASVVATLERLQKLGIKLFSCVDRLLNAFSEAPRLELDDSRSNLKKFVEQRQSLFSPALDDFEFYNRAGRRQGDRRQAYLRHEDLSEGLLLAALRKDFSKTPIGAAGLSEVTIDILFQTCMDSECVKYNCPASLLIQCVRDYITAGSTLPPEMNRDGQAAAVHFASDLVYVSVISSLTKRTQVKMPNHTGAADALSRSEESIAALTAELLEAFHYDLPKLNLFLSKLSTINVDTMWKILKYLHNSKLDFNNIRDDEYEIEIQTEGIMTDLSSAVEPSMKNLLAPALRYLLSQHYSFMHLLIYQEGHVAENLKAAVRLAAYKMDPFNLETVRLVRSADGRKDPRKFLVGINKHIQKIIRNRPQVPLSLTELIRKLTTVEGKIGPLTQCDLLSSIKNIVGSDEERMIPLGKYKKLSVGLLTLRDIKDWANYVRGTEIDPTEAICVANRVVNLSRSWDLTTEQILAIFLGLSQSNERNLFLELSTGSGKSVVIAVIAAVKALRGNQVDVYTSNHLLARRDVQEWEQFYKRFNLSCSSNGDEAVTYAEGPKECYDKDIVYGDIKQFQFDDLRTEFMGLDTRSGRPYKYVIIDEVDSILLDEGSNLAMLSTTFTAIDKLGPIYHLIRSALISLDSDQTYYSVDGALHHYKGDGEPLDGRNLTLFEARREYLKRKIEAFIRALLGIDVAGMETWKIEDHFQLPPHLLKYAKSQISNWAEAAITAEELEEKKDYLLVDNKVVPIDPHTGVLQESSNWGNGLHQFLQIKHEVEFTPESPTTNYLSNWAMVKKYKNGIVGLTGTLGSTESFDILSQQMSADCVSLPNRCLSRFVEFPNIIVRTRQEWRQAIAESTDTEIIIGRAVLIICQTVKEAQRLHLELEAKHNFRVKLHVRSDTWMEHHLQQVQPGDVIVTTNLGTRGMDIQASVIESVGGLHVILAYMPPNTRIVRQAFGRTSRKGNLGSGHFIIKQKDGILQPADIMKHITSSEISDFERYFEHELPLVAFKDKVYADFVSQYCRAREDIRRLALEDERSFINKASRAVRKALHRANALSGAKFIILEAIQEVWANYLKLVVDHPSGDQQYLSVNEFKDLLGYALNEGCRDPKELFRRTGNCFHPTRYGFQVYRKLGSLNDPQSTTTKFLSYAEDSVMSKSTRLTSTAAEYFTMAIDIAPKQSPAAHVGLAYVRLKRGTSSPGVGHHGVHYKSNALSNLKNATAILDMDITHLRCCLKQLSNPSTSPLANQLTNKIEALEAYVKVIDETSRTVQQSFCPVQVSATRNNVTKTVWISGGNITPSTDFQEIFETGHEVALEFHGLKANKDVGGYSFQCENAVKLLYDKMGHVHSKNTIDQPTVSLIIEGHDIKSANSPARGRFWKVPTPQQDKASPLQWKTLPGVLPNFELKLDSIQTWDQLEEITQALSSRYKIILRSVEDVTSNLSSLASESPLDRDNAVSRAKPFSKAIGCSNETNGGVAEEMNQVTIDMAPLKAGTRKLLVEELLRKKIPFDVSLEGVHLEHNKVSLRSQKYLQNCRRVSILLPLVIHATHGADIQGRQEQILQAVRRYCETFRKEGITPTLKVGCLDPTVAKTLYDKVVRDSESMQQLQLVPLRDLKFEKPPSAEALRQIEQQGLLLVASFAEKNPIPKKAIVLVGAVATIELAAGLLLCAFEVPLGLALIKMALTDVWKVQTMREEREFSFVKFAVEKVAEVAKKGLGEIIQADWLDKFVSSLANANSVNELGTIVINQLEPLTLAQINESGPMTAHALFFLYFEVGGLKTKIIKKIKDNLNSGQQSVPILELLKDSSARELFATFHAVITIAFYKDANEELKSWLNSMDQVKLWCQQESDGLKLVEWEILMENTSGKEGNFGLHLLKVIKDAALHNLNVHCRLACVNILKELNSHCSELCMKVLDSNEFQADEIQVIKQHMKQTNGGAMSPVVKVCRILDENVGNSTIDPQRLTTAREKFQKIKDHSSKLLKDSDFKKGLKNSFLHYFQDALNGSEVLDQIIMKSAPPTSISAANKSAKIVDLQESSLTSPSDHRNSISKHSNKLSTHSIWEASVTRRLIQKVSQGSCPEPMDDLPPDLSSELPTLIILLHETQVDAALLRTEDYEKFESGNSKDSLIVIYKLVSGKCQLQRLEVMQGGEKRIFEGPKLVLEAMGYITGCPVANVQSILETFMETQNGKKIYIGLLELCQTQIDHSDTKPEKACALQ